MTRTRGQAHEDQGAEHDRQSGVSAHQGCSGRGPASLAIDPCPRALEPARFTRALLPPVVRPRPLATSFIGATGAPGPVGGGLVVASRTPRHRRAGRPPSIAWRTTPRQTTRSAPPTSSAKGRVWAIGLWPRDLSPSWTATQAGPPTRRCRLDRSLAGRLGRCPRPPGAEADHRCPRHRLRLGRRAVRVESSPAR